MIAPRARRAGAGSAPRAARAAVVDAGVGRRQPTRPEAQVHISDERMSRLDIPVIIQATHHSPVFEGKGTVHISDGLSVLGYLVRRLRAR
jgi:hypothetical protein